MELSLNWPVDKDALFHIIVVGLRCYEFLSFTIQRSMKHSMTTLIQISKR